jgi:hypothetical protein
MDRDQRLTRIQPRGSGNFYGLVKFAAGVIAGASLGCALASAAQLVRHDGVFWKALDKQDKAAYIDGYSDAASLSLGKLDQLKVAADLFHWKGANKILDQLKRGLDLSGLPAHDLALYLDNVYSNPQYSDFDVANAIELAVMRDIVAKPSAPQDAPSSPSASSAKH